MNIKETECNTILKKLTHYTYNSSDQRLRQINKLKLNDMKQENKSQLKEH